MCNDSAFGTFLLKTESSLKGGKKKKKRKTKENAGSTSQHSASSRYHLLCILAHHPLEHVKYDLICRRRCSQHCSRVVADVLPITTCDAQAARGKGFIFWGVVVAQRSVMAESVLIVDHTGRESIRPPSPSRKTRSLYLLRCEQSYQPR